MPKVIAIQPDRFQTKHGSQSFSEVWMRQLSGVDGVSVREVDIYQARGLESVHGADAFLWRGTGDPHTATARRIIPAIEQGLRIPTFPSARTAWLTRDKVAQSLLLTAAALPTPKTWIFFTLDKALEFLDDADFPLVIKLANGRGSSDVALLHDKDEAIRLAHCLFGAGLGGQWEGMGSEARLAMRRLRRSIELARGSDDALRREGGYAYFQEFVPGNAHDTRVTLIGERAFAFRRLNRAGDFRASGSGLIDWAPDKIPAAAIALAFKVAHELDLPFIALDLLERNGAPEICEINFAYASWAVRACPGSWSLDGATPIWHPGELSPEALTLHEFMRMHGLADTGYSH